MIHYDSIVIGGGFNSLITASILGQSGKKVLLLEASEQIGGLASTTEIVPGFQCNLINDVVKWIDPRVMKKLNLESHGLSLYSPNIVRIALDTQGKHLSFFRDSNDTAESIANHSDKDAKVWTDFTKYINRCAYFLEKLYELSPPKLPNLGFKEMFSMSSMLTPLRKYGTRGLVDFMRVSPMSMLDLMDEWFEAEFLRSAISTAGIHHLSFGPYAAGTGFNLLHQHVHGEGNFHNANFVKGGTKQLMDAVKISAESANVEIRINTKVTSINVKNEICSGVTLENGEIIHSEQTVSGLDPNNTFIDLVGPLKLNPSFFTQIRNIRYRGSTARIHFTLNELPEINGVSKDQMGTVFSVSPSIEYLERASDSVKYGQIAANPYVEFTIPSVLNSGFAPNGKHVLSATVQYAPYHLRDKNWSDELKSHLKNNVVGVLGNYIHGFSSFVDSSIVWSPVDFENQFGLTEGNLNHGEMTLDQFMFMRPTMSAAQYKSPIENLYLCGPSTHPGGGLHGANGYNAASEILK